MYLNTLGGENAIGRMDMVENRYIGIKSRGVYETPGAAILRVAHLDLEGVAMDKEVTHIRNMLMPKFSELVYNGYWFSPEMIQHRHFLSYATALIHSSRDVTPSMTLLNPCSGRVTSPKSSAFSFIAAEDFPWRINS